jgi:glyoxylase-like metal-dependent hydrolase (beta-lactamase superfamily II)
MRVWAFSAGSIESSARLMKGHGPFFSGHHVSLTCILMESEKRLVLIDTGWGSPTVSAPDDFPGRLFRWTAGLPRVTADETALGRIERLGFRAKDLTDVVLTHLDIDHVGGLVDFPAATVHVSRLEHVARFHRAQPFRSRIHDSSKAFSHGPRFQLHDLTDHSELGFSRSADLFGDGSVMLLSAHGHTPGHSAVRVRAGDRSLIHAGDAFVQSCELDGEDHLPLGVRAYRKVLHEDKSAASQTLEVLRNLRRDHSEVTLVNSHDATLLARLPTFPQEAF